MEVPFGFYFHEEFKFVVVNKPSFSCHRYDWLYNKGINSFCDFIFFNNYLWFWSLNFKSLSPGIAIFPGFVLSNHLQKLKQLEMTTSVSLSWKGFITIASKMLKASLGKIIDHFLQSHSGANCKNKNKIKIFFRSLI